MSSEVPSTVAPGVYPVAEVEITESMVRRLLAAQFPEATGQPLERLANGWDNVMYRLGRDLAVRLPRRLAAVDLITTEQRWLPTIARLSSLPVPRPVFCGHPGAGFPWPWSVVEWIPGRSADACPPSRTEAAVLGRFLQGIHSAPPHHDAPRNPFRGIPLSARRSALADRLARLETVETGLRHPVHLVGAALNAAMDVQIDGVNGWLHGDLHARNVIVEDGRITGVVDWGDMCAGDVATDLAAPWILFEPADHAAFWDAYGAVSDSTAQRARGWALFFGVMLLDSSLDSDPAFAAVGRQTIDRVLTSG